MRVRGFVFIAAAIAVHMTIPAIARIAPRWEPPILARSSRTMRIEAIDVEVNDPPRADAVAMRTDEPTPREARVAPRNADPSRNAVSPEPSSEPRSTASATPTTAPAPGPSDYDRPPEGPAGVGGIPGLGNQPVWALPGVLPSAVAPAPAPTTTPREARTDRDTATKVLGAVLNAKNHELGLDLPGAGTIAAKIVEAVWASDTPATATATFQVRLSSNGQVVSVRAVGAGGAPSGAWQSAASAAAAKLSGFTIPMPAAYAAGAVVTVQVVSDLTMPSGKPKGFNTFDLADVGAKKHRVVTSSFSVSPAT